MQLQTFGTLSNTALSIGAGALTQSTEYSYLALPLAEASGVFWLILLCVFLYRNRKQFRTSMASWYFIAPCLIVAVLAIAGGAYGLGLRATSTPDQGDLRKTAVTVPVAPKIEYVENQEIGSTFNPNASPQSAIIYQGKLTVIGNRLRIFVDLLEGSDGWPFNNRRIKVAELKDYVRGQQLQIPIAIREDDEQKNWIFRWGESDYRFRAPDAGIFYGRVSLIGDSGDEQHCYFMIVPWTINGRPWLHVIPATRLNFAEGWEKKDASKAP